MWISCGFKSRDLFIGTLVAFKFSLTFAKSSAVYSARSVQSCLFMHVHSAVLYIIIIIIIIIIKYIYIAQIRRKNAANALELSAKLYVRIDLLLCTVHFLTVYTLH